MMMIVVVAGGGGGTRDDGDNVWYIKQHHTHTQFEVNQKCLCARNIAVL